MTEIYLHIDARMADYLPVAFERATSSKSEDFVLDSPPARASSTAAWISANGPGLIRGLLGVLELAVVRVAKRVASVSCSFSAFPYNR